MFTEYRTTSVKSMNSETWENGDIWPRDVHNEKNKEAGPC